MIVCFCTGQKVSISFDEATMLGTDRYLTVNTHCGTPVLGKSSTVALGLIRADSRATGEYLSERVT